VALLIVSLPGAWWSHDNDVNELAKMNSLPPAEYVARLRELHTHSPVLTFITLLIMGAVFLAIIDLIVATLRYYGPHK